MTHSPYKITHSRKLIAKLEYYCTVQTYFYITLGKVTEERDSMKKYVSEVIIFIEPEVGWVTEAYSYDLFCLLVEVGSCLGLWLGLSIIGIFDVLTEIIDKMKTYLTQNVTKTSVTQF